MSSWLDIRSRPRPAEYSSLISDTSMTSDPIRAQVTAAVLAMLKARSALFTSSPTRLVVKPLLRRSEGGSGGVPTGAQDTLASHNGLPGRAVPSPVEIEAAQEAALAAFPEEVRAAARQAFHERLLALEGKAPPKARQKNFGPPSPIPTNLPQRPSVDQPPFPAAGLDHPAVRGEWASAHRTLAEARYRLQPAVLRAYAETQVARDKWESQQRGRKPSGDLRHPVPRDRLERIVAEMTLKHEREIARAESTIHAIETGDVVGVRFFGLGGDADEGDVPMLVLQSALDRKAAEQYARANRTPEQIEADEAKWDEMVEELLADLPPSEPESEQEIPNLPSLPTDRQPTRSEIAAFSSAIRQHLNYLERGEQIQAKRKKDAATKVRTRARLEAERANPERAAEAKAAVKLRKAAERQRRWRERKKADKDSEG